MKTFTRYFAFRLATCLTILAFFGPAVKGMAQETWKLRKDRNGVKVFTRDYPNSKFKEYKAQMVVENTTLDIVKEIILDADKLKDWNYKTSKSRLIEKIDENTYVLYLYNDMPWPVLNRDHVSVVKVTYPSNRSVLIDIRPDNSVLPETDGVVRIMDFKGFWLLEETEEGIAITHQLFGDPEGGVPSWLVNSQLVKSPYTSFNNLKTMLENKQD